MKYEDNSNYVLVIGSSNIDLNIYSKKLPTSGETVTGGKFQQNLGGKGANQAVASIRSGSKTVFIAKVGTDIYGEQMISQLSKEGINTDYMIHDLSESSGIAFIMVDEKGENMISVAPGANANLLPHEIRNNSELIKNAKVVVVQMEISTDTIEEIFNIASQGDAIKILNPAPLKYLSPHILRNIDIIVPNEGELYGLHSSLNLGDLTLDLDGKMKQASRDIAKTGITTIITTLGSKGSIIFQADTDIFTHIPTLDVQVIDTVGAGDCFIGVLASIINQGEDIVKAVKYASAAASIAVTREGAQDSMPHREEINVNFKKLEKLRNRGEL
ncbi:MAG: ribokinase [Candidatus Lokiarchaeota archaeon]|nr:ribokinase [Candidatus Lokiarchaeota archaeon]